jgi:hypothetical protein
MGPYNTFILMAIAGGRIGRGAERSAARSTQSFAADALALTERVSDDPIEAQRPSRSESGQSRDRPRGGAVQIGRLGIVDAVRHRLFTVRNQSAINAVGLDDGRRRLAGLCRAHPDIKFV